MAELVIGKIGLEGMNLNLIPASEFGNSFRNNTNNNIVFFQNEGVDPVIVTILAQKTCNHGHLHDQEIEVPANSQVAVGNIERARFNNEEDMVLIDYSDPANILVGVGNPA